MEKHLSEMSLAELTREEGIRCSCGKIHRCGLRFFRAGPGAVNTLPEALRNRSRSHPMIVMDENTEQAAGAQVRSVLREAVYRRRLK